MTIILRGLTLIIKNQNLIFNKNKKPPSLSALGGFKLRFGPDKDPAKATLL
jgi:hypothetical protein